MTAVGKIFKPALKRDCAERHLGELLCDEPIESLAVREVLGRGQVVHIVLQRQEPQARESRMRIDAALKPYLLSIDWNAPPVPNA